MCDTRPTGWLNCCKIEATPSINPFSDDKTITTGFIIALGGNAPSQLAVQLRGWTNCPASQQNPQDRRQGSHCRCIIFLTRHKVVCLNIYAAVVARLRHKRYMNPVFYPAKKRANNFVSNEAVVRFVGDISSISF